MKTTEIRELTAGEIIERVEAEKANLLKAKLNHAVSPAENTNTIKNMRRDIARLLTILREKQTATINK
jgi:large subunit ribosomal protein L29